MKIEIKMLDDTLYQNVNEFGVPSAATFGSAAVDLMIKEDICIKGGECKKVGTGVAISINDNNVAAIVLPRSGMGSRGLILGNTIGLIDSDYQGEIILSLWNRDKEYTIFTLKRGMKVAQLIFIPIVVAELVKVDSFSIKTARGEGGFGSTGV